jgi:hypothetical protein
MQTDPVLNLCKLLLDEDRMLILGMLAQQPRRGDELAAFFPAKSSAVSRLARHLKQLQTAGLVTVDSTAGGEVYSLAVEQLQQIKRQLFSRDDESRQLTEDEKMLAAFVKEGQLQQLPVQPAKMRVVLGWLAEKFQPGVEYPERTVNELLQGHEIDHATLRRLLIDYGLLTRQAGVYRRVEGV